MLIVRKPQEPAWTPVLGAEVLFAPIDRAMLIRARRAAREAANSEADDERPTIDLLDEIGDAMSRALIMEGVKDWRGVCLMADDRDDGTGTDLPFSAENLLLVLADPVTFEAFDDAYVVPFVTRERQRGEPGNVSAASPNGTGEAAMPDSDTASFPVPPQADAGAQPAPTSSTKRGRRRKKGSGES